MQAETVTTLCDNLHTLLVVEEVALRVNHLYHLLQSKSHTHKSKPEGQYRSDWFLTPGHLAGQNIIELSITNVVKSIKNYHKSNNPTRVN